MIGYYLDPENNVLCFNFEGWEAIGAGKYASGLCLGQFLNRRSILMRKQGYDRVEGMYELIKAGLTTTENFHEAGGNINIVYIDGKGTSHSGRYREIFDERARLAGEIVRANLAGILEKDRVMKLLDKLLFKSHSFGKIESELFRVSSDKRHLELVLRGYKLDEIPLILSPGALKPGSSR
jgi:hypothetical protein